MISSFAGDKCPEGEKPKLHKSHILHYSKSIQYMALANKNFLDQTKTNIWSYKDLNQMAQKLRRLYLGRSLSIKNLLELP